MKPILLNPGPVTLSERVRRALLSPDLCHREPEFGALQESVRAGLTAVYGLDPGRWSAVLLAGSGTSAVEAMVASLVPRGGALLAVENGVYGERLSAIARAHGIPARALRRAWGERVEPGALADALDGAPDTTHVALVHHETTTGRLNDLAALSSVCRERGVALLIDGVSSFGGEALDLEGWGASAVAATANKCLHGVPGVAFVLARSDALEVCADAPRSVVLDLAAHARAQAAGSTAFTAPVHVLYALDEALRELAEQGGWSQRHARYARLSATVRAALVELGVEPLLAAAESSVVLGAYRLPAGVRYDELHDGLKRLGFVIYAGQGALAREIFRVSTMGAIEDSDVERLVAALGERLGSRGASAPRRTD